LMLHTPAPRGSMYVYCSTTLSNHITIRLIRFISRFESELWNDFLLIHIYNNWVVSLVQQQWPNTLSFFFQKKATDCKSHHSLACVRVVIWLRTSGQSGFGGCN
jgi:hypothetical protein